MVKLINDSDLDMFEFHNESMNKRRGAMAPTRAAGVDAALIHNFNMS
jgi:hypothetical protein